jgi:hypothetical protein
MRTPAPHAPGWYPDHEDSSLVRYWDGQGWTGKLRPRPNWAPLETELIRLAPPLPAHRGLRDRLTTLLALIVVLALVLGGIVISRGRARLAPARPHATLILSNPRYVEAANAICASLLRSSTTRAGAVVTSAGPAKGGPAGGGRTPGGGPALASRAGAARLVRNAAAVYTSLESLETDPSGTAAVNTWLEQWARLVSASTRYAQDLAAHRHPSAAEARQVEVARQQVDSTARISGIRSCQV